MSQTQFLVVLREAGVLRTVGLRAALEAFWGAAAAAVDSGTAVAGSFLEFYAFLGALETLGGDLYQQTSSEETDAAAEAEAAVLLLITQLLSQLPDLLLTKGAPATMAFVEWLETSNGGDRDGDYGGNRLAATCSMAGCSWPDEHLLAIYNAPECLEALCAGHHQALLRALFRRFAPRGSSGADAAMTPERCTQLLRALHLVAPACGERGGRGLTVLEGRQCAYASRPLRLQGGTPKAPAALSYYEFVEWMARCALLAFGWQLEGGGAEAEEAGAFGPSAYSTTAKRLWAAAGSGGTVITSSAAAATLTPTKHSKRVPIQQQARHLAAFSASWVGEPPPSPKQHETIGGTQSVRPPFDTVSTLAPPSIKPLNHTAAQRRAIQQAADEAAAMAEEAEAQRMLRHVAARLAGIEDRAAAAARRGELQRRSAQAVCQSATASPQLSHVLLSYGAAATWADVR